MQHWALTLLGYEYDLLYRPGEQNANADSLSPLPLPDLPETTPVPGDIDHLLETINASPVDAAKVKFLQLATQCSLKSCSLSFMDGL